jgi:hypothetical protein
MAGLLKYYDSVSSTWVPILAGPTGPTGADSNVTGPTGATGTAGNPEFSHTLLLGGM